MSVWSAAANSFTLPGNFLLCVRGQQLAVHNIAAIDTKDYPTKAARSLNSRLDLSRLETVFGIRMPDWQEALETELNEFVLHMDRAMQSWAATPSIALNRENDMDRDGWLFKQRASAILNPHICDREPCRNGWSGRVRVRRPIRGWNNGRSGATRSFSWHFPGSAQRLREPAHNLCLRCELYGHAKTEDEGYSARRGRHEGCAMMTGPGIVAVIALIVVSSVHPSHG
jgi:hypothetical protein